VVFAEKTQKIHFFSVFTENLPMAIVTGYTIQGIADELGIPYNTARMRIDRLGLEPITDGKIFPLEALEAIRNVPGKGRPPKPKPEAEQGK